MMRWRTASTNEMARSDMPQTSQSHDMDGSDDITSSATPADETSGSGPAMESAEGATSNALFHSRLDSDHEEEEDELFTDDDDGLRERVRHRMKKRQHSSFSSADDPNDPGDTFPLNIHDEEGMDHSQPPPDDEHASIEWRPQTSQSTCEFTHTIMNYSQKRESGCKKAEYSATTVDEFGNRWRLIVYVNGNGRASNHHLSLFLQVADADDLPFGWKKAVSYVLTLEHPSGNNLSYAKRNPDKTFKLCPKAIDWGWSQFITSDRIQQEGFIQDDSLTVRACVTVKSSSVTIDADDSELYLKCAVEEGNEEGVKLCLNQGAGVNCQFKDDLYTPLHTACSSASPTSTSEDGNMRVLELLLERGADGNACNKWRETPLLIAANNGHRAAVEALLKHGADPSLCSEAGWSALTFAAHKGYDDIVALLLRAGAPVNCRVTEDSSTPLHKACAGSKPGHLTAVKQLLDGRADVHALNKWRETPLLTAANHGQAGAVDALLRAGADPCKCTDTGWSPLSIAAYKGHDDVVKLLLEEGAPTEEADPTLSALLQAATKGLPGTVELLLQHGADHTVTTKKGDTALSILVEQNLIDAAVEMVTEYKASIPRCSRDRKKVQRARLLINLRIKQMQKDGTYRNNGGNMGDYGVDDDDDDDAETDQEDGAGSPQHGKSNNGQGNKGNKSSPRKKKKKKGGRKKMSAEEQAKAAEEALLLELDQEMAQAEKVQQEASKKSAKKKKKKERERLQKQKEEQERKEKEEKEKQEKDKIRKAKEERQRKEREEKAKIQREKEMEERNKAMEAMAKRREKEEKERQRQQRLEKQRKAEQQKVQQEQEQQKRQREQEREREQQKAQTALVAKQKAQQQTTKGSTKKVGNAAKSAVRPDTMAATAPSSAASASSVTAAPTASKPITGKNRGWETKVKPAAPQTNATRAPEVAKSAAPAVVPVPVVAPMSHSTSLGANVTTSGMPPHTTQPTMPMSRSISDFQPGNDAMSAHSGSIAPQLMGFNPAPAKIDLPSNPFGEMQSLLTPSKQQNHHNVFGMTSGGSNSADRQLMNGLSGSSLLSHVPAPDVSEHPALALFREEKISALISRFTVAPNQISMDPLHVIDAPTAKRVIYRWIIRAAHDNHPSLDCVIPSWIDFTYLTTFFQRQFIAENHKASGPGASMRNGMVGMEALKEAGVAMATLCQNLAKDVAEFRRQLDSQVPPDWSDNGIGMTARSAMQQGSSHVFISWSNRSQVDLARDDYDRLSQQFVGRPNRMLSALFHLKVRHNTVGLIVDGTEMDSQLSVSFRQSAIAEASARVELWSNPLTVLGDNTLWGQFADIDCLFGAAPPFGSGEGSSDESLSRIGGSVVVMLPMDSMVASVYVNRMVTLLQAADNDRVPLSFVAILRNECFHDRSSAPMPTDLRTLDPRLHDQCQHYLRRAETLVAGQHTFAKKDDSTVVSETGSLLVVVQNGAAGHRFDVSDMAMTKLVAALSLPTQQLVAPMSFSAAAPETNDFGRPRASSSDFLDTFAPMPNQGLNPGATEFGGVGNIGGIPLSSAFSSAPSPAVSHDILGSTSKAASRRPANSSRRLFDLVDDTDDNINDVDVVSGMLNNLNVDLFQSSGVSGQDVDIEAISLMGIGNTSAGGSRLQRNGSHGRFG